MKVTDYACFGALLVAVPMMYVSREAFLIGGLTGGLLGAVVGWIRRHES